jgi:hypothetical protein
MTTITHAIPINVLDRRICLECKRKFTYTTPDLQLECDAPRQLKCGHVYCGKCLELCKLYSLGFCGHCGQQWEAPCFDVASPKEFYRDRSKGPEDRDGAIVSDDEAGGEEQLVYLHRDNKANVPPTFRYRKAIIKALTIANRLAKDPNHVPIDSKYSHSQGGCFFRPDKNKSLSPVPNNGAYKIGIASFIYFHGLLSDTPPPCFIDQSDKEIWLRSVWYALERIPSTLFDTHQEIVNELSYGAWCGYRKIKGLETNRDGWDIKILKELLEKSVQLAAEFGHGFEEGVYGEHRKKPAKWVEAFRGVRTGEGY